MDFFSPIYVFNQDSSPGTTETFNGGPSGALYKKATGLYYKVGTEENLIYGDGGIFSVPTAKSDDGDFENGSIQFYLDETNSKLKIRIKKSNGTFEDAELSFL